MTWSTDISAGGARTAALAERLAEARLLAVVTVARAADVVPLLEALGQGGIRAVEFTLRTEAAIDVIRAARQARPDLLIGAGTVLTPAQADAAKAAGADFALAPGLDLETVRHCAAAELLYVPGVASASEIQAALKAGSRLLKIFPADCLGGARGLRTLVAPFSHLGLKFIPLGGIGLETAAAYLAEPSVTAVGGSWIATPEMVQRRAWSEIARRAAEARILWR